MMKKNDFCIQVNPVPKFRMPNRMKWSPKGKACMEYQKEIAQLANLLKVPKFGKADVEFGYIHFYRKGRRCDVDNLLKSLLDGLQYGGIFDNDNQVVAITALKVFYVKTEAEARIEFNIFKA